MGDRRGSMVYKKVFDNSEYGEDEDDVQSNFSKLDIQHYGRKVTRMDDYEEDSASFEEELVSIEERIMKWDDESEGLISEKGKKELSGYLQAVDDLQRLIDGMKELADDDSKDFHLLHRMEGVRHQAMCKLEEEFRILLEKHSETLDPDSVFDGFFNPPIEEDDTEGDDDSNRVPVAQPVENLNFTLDLMQAEVAEQVSEIASRMINCGYVAECSHIYGFVRKIFLEESVGRLGFEKMSIEEVQRIPWNVLEVEITKWMQVLRVSVNVFMTSERKLCERIFADFPHHVETCFGELARGILIQMLSFAEAVAISNRAPEKLFKILDMYEVLWELIPKINHVFTGSIGETLRTEAYTVWRQLGEAARGTFLELENAIQGDVGKNPVAGGAIHPLTRYVMNYLRLACAYRKTLEDIFKEDENRDVEIKEGSNHSDASSENSEHYVFLRSTSRFEPSPLSRRIIAIVSLLEDNLMDKSKAYKDQALGYLFLMNNCRYIVQKVKDEEIHNLLGDDWIRRQSSIVRRYHKNYQRASWVKVLNCLTSEGITVNGNLSSGASKAALKERFKTFNSLFEEIHKTQSSWIVADEQLRAELRISITEVLLPAYRQFLGRFQNQLDNGRSSEKYIKYETEDLELLVNELFEGTTNSMGKRRSSSSNN